MRRPAQLGHQCCAQAPRLPQLRRLKRPRRPLRRIRRVQGSEARGRGCRKFRTEPAHSDGPRTLADRRTSPFGSGSRPAASSKARSLWRTSGSVLRNRSHCTHSSRRAARGEGSSSVPEAAPCLSQPSARRWAHRRDLRCLPDRIVGKAARVSSMGRSSAPPQHRDIRKFRRPRSRPARPAI
jgi:hypothetical protein